MALYKQVFILTMEFLCDVAPFYHIIHVFELSIMYTTAITQSQHTAVISSSLSSISLIVSLSFWIVTSWFLTWANSELYSCKVSRSCLTSISWSWDWISFCCWETACSRTGIGSFSMCVCVTNGLYMFDCKHVHRVIVLYTNVVNVCKYVLLVFHVHYSQNVPGTSIILLYEVKNADSAAWLRLDRASISPWKDLSNGAAFLRISSDELFLNSLLNSTSFFLDSSDASCLLATSWARASKSCWMCKHERVKGYL